MKKIKSLTLILVAMTISACAQTDSAAFSSSNNSLNTSEATSTLPSTASQSHWYSKDNSSSDIDSKLDRALNVSPINCYVVPKSYGVNLTKDQLEGGMFKMVSIPLANNYAVVNNYGNSSFISIPYDGLDFGDYYIYLYIEDNSTLKNSYLTAASYLW